jgi:predicted NBD/HSP70 family sugar kinase
MSEEPGGDLSRLRQLNSLAAVRALRNGQPLTLTALAKRTGLSRTSTEDVIRELAERGWVVEVEPATGTPGRPARRYRFRADAGRVLGVDVGGHTIRALVADLDGKVLDHNQVAVTPRLGRSERIAALDECVLGALTGARVRPDQIWSTGVATTGLIDGAGQVMFSDSLTEWTGVDLAAHMKQLVTAPTRVENDAKLAALAESWRGVARYADNVVFLLAGLRTGAGLIVDGKLYHGFSNAAGEIGALPAAGWIRAVEHLHAWAGTQQSRVEDVFPAARAGNRDALRAVRSFTRALGVGVSALVLTLDPELVVIGGGFSRSADLIVDPLRRELDRWCLRTPEIRVSTFGEDGVALGAVRLALEQIETDLRQGADPLRQA